MLAPPIVTAHPDPSGGSVITSSPEELWQRPWILDNARCWPVTAIVECAGSIVHRPGRGVPESPGRVSVMTPTSSPWAGTVTERATGTEPGAATISVAGPASVTGTSK